MTRAALLLPIRPCNGVATATIGAVAGALALVAATPLLQRADGDTWLLVQAIDGDAAARHQTADHALRLLRSEPRVAAANRITASAALQALHAALGTPAPPGTPLPETIEVRVAQDVDPATVQMVLRRTRGLAITIQRAEPRARRVPIAACLLAIGAASGAAAIGAWRDAGSLVTSLAVLHRLGAPRSRIVREAVVPATGSFAIGIAGGTMLASLLPGIGGGITQLVAVPLGLLAVAALASICSAIRQCTAFS